jgi:glycosyltransferase involved in cell wall biosynthesis
MMAGPSRAEGGRRFRSPVRAAVPLVSIVIVVFRARHELQSLLGSIFAAGISELGADLEVIVIDGGSDDGTVDLLRDWNDRIDYWLSEPDAGIYNAMNKGVAAATGHYILHLNAGDRLRAVPGDGLRECLAEGIDVVCCRVLMDDSVLFTPRTGMRLRIENTWHHQGTFYRRLAHPSYDESYRVFGDFDLNQRLAKAGRPVRVLETVVADHRNDGISVSGRDRHSSEVWRCVRTNSGVLYVPIAFAWHKVYFLRQILASFRRLIASKASDTAK